MKNIDSKQEYLYNGGYVTIYAEVVGDEGLVVVSNGNDYGELMVADKSQLKKKEDSYYYKRAEERRKELENITADARARFDELVEEVIEKACSTLSTRMKFNTIFSKDIGNASGWAIQVSNELEKLIKEKAPKVMEKDIFA